ncbi:MAG: phosphatase domain-containing protein [Pseudomonadota bacterium]
MFSACRQGFERAVRLLAKSASRTARRGEIVVQTYRGYGSRQRLFLMGRVLRRPSPDISGGEGLWHNLKAVWRLMRAWGIDDARLSARFGDAEATISTDHDGYFRLDLDLLRPPPADKLWHQVTIRLDRPVDIEVEGNVFIPGQNCSFAVISDIDDTVMRTGVANKLLMMWRLFVQGAESRTAFPGMASFLRALHRGRKQRDDNPMLYVSRAPWAIYDVLDRFFNLHGIPEGPILFLREWGLTLQNPFPRRGKGHKIDFIRQMIAHYEGLPFILIGDSGQRDPEVYAEIAREFPDRILAVYIRDVSRDARRDQAIAGLAEGLGANAGSLVLAADTATMADHAADQGLIARSTLAEIKRAR